MHIAEQLMLPSAEMMLKNSVWLRAQQRPAPEHGIALQGPTTLP